MATIESENQYGIDGIGRLKSFGVDEPWKAALLLPRKWESFAMLTDHLSAMMDDETGLLVAKVASTPKFAYKNGPPRASFLISDAEGVSVYASQMGNTGAVKESAVVGKRLLLKGKRNYFDNKLRFQIAEIVDKRWAGKLRPIYPAKPGVISAELVRSRILSLLPAAIPEAAQHMRKSLSILGDDEHLLKISNAPVNTLEALLWAAHLPVSEAMGDSAQTALERLAAADLLLKAQKAVGGVKKREPIRLSLEHVAERKSALPYPLTDEQSKATGEILEDLRRPSCMRRLLSGDVGTGKTAVYGTAIASAYDAGARCVVLLPNINLATQVLNEMQSYWPDIPMQLVRADTKKKEDLSEVPVLVGTTALLSRNIGDRDLVVTDEQQKFSKAQREQMLNGNGHLLEVSATCIPRSQALLSFGVMDLSKLTKGHVDKDITTKIHYKEDRKVVFNNAKSTVAQGGQLAVVYPLKESKADDNDVVDEEEQRKSAIKMYENWDAYFPGRVRLLHGQLTDDEKQSVIDDMKQDKADILISTTVIEVGLTLPRLQRLLVISADRHGLTGLHQLRGRPCRHGGTGYFDLYLPSEKDAVNPDVIKRLSILEETTDGFKVAEHDMLQRGCGELSGEKQSGKDTGFILGRSLEVSRLSEMSSYLPDMADRKPAPVPYNAITPVAQSDGFDNQEYLKWFGSESKAQNWIQKQESPQSFVLLPASSNRYEVYSLDDDLSPSVDPLSSQEEKTGMQIGLF